MSGIAGILADEAERPISAEEAAMLGLRLSHRGPDGILLWHQGRVVLAHAHLGPAENVCSTLGAKDSPYKLIGDIRLDDPDDLCRALGLDRSTAHADLIVAAYERWGTACCERLMGDFAFALWDARARRLFCARDRFGVRPFYYRQDAGVFSFASEAKILPGGRCRASDEEIAAYLAELTDSRTTTFDPEILRLAAGHFLIRHEGRTVVERYWRLEPESHPDAHAVEEFRQRFETAVRRCLVEPRPVGVMLSGGLDSSAIAAMTANLESASGRSVPTFSIVYPSTPSLDERRHIDAVLATGRFAPTFIPADDHVPLHEIEALFAEQGGLFAATGLTKSRRLYSEASSKGIKVILDGHGGDEVVGHGTERLYELAMQGAWLTLAREVQGYSKIFGTDPVWLYLALFSRYGSRNLPGRALRRVAVHVGRRRQGSGLSQAAAPWRSYLSEEFKRRTGIEERERAATQASPSLDDQDSQGRGDHMETLDSPRVQASFEILDKTSAAFGIEARYPFYDVELARLCLGLSSRQKLRNGVPRYILRQALRDILPPSVRDRRDKIDFTREVTVGLPRHHKSVLNEMLLDRNGMTSAYFDMATLRAGVRRLCDDPSSISGFETRFLWRAAALQVWLQGRASEITTQDADRALAAPAKDTESIGNAAEL